MACHATIAEGFWTWAMIFPSNSWPFECNDEPMHLASTQFLVDSPFSGTPSHSQVDSWKLHKKPISFTLRTWAETLRICPSYRQSEIVKDHQLNSKCHWPWHQAIKYHQISDFVQKLVDSFAGHWPFRRPMTCLFFWIYEDIWGVKILKSHYNIS